MERQSADPWLEKLNETPRIIAGNARNRVISARRTSHRLTPASSTQARPPLWPTNPAGVVRHFLFYCVLLTFASQAQEADTSKVQVETPVMALQKFKAALDNTDYPAICRLMAEEDASGPLKPVRYEQTQRSIEGLVNMWRGMPFQYLTTTIRTEGTPPTSTVQVNILNLRQEVKFVLLKFGQSWYVFDIEIYFK